MKHWTVKTLGEQEGKFFGKKPLTEVAIFALRKTRRLAQR
jgi:hypothetical protein